MLLYTHNGVIVRYGITIILVIIVVIVKLLINAMPVQLNCIVFV